MKTWFLNPMILLIVLCIVCPLQAIEEDALIAVLQSDAGAVDKCAACQQLRIYGTAKSVDALASVLADERTGHAARYALEAMPYPQAGQAMRNAIGQTSGSVKAGLVDSVGRRRDADAVPLLVPLLSDADAMVAVAAASALGSIGGKEAAAALETACSYSSLPVQTAALQGLLQCAEHAIRIGDSSSAIALYHKLLQCETSPVIRAASWRGLALSDTAQRSAHIVKALCGSDAFIQDAALKLVRELKDAALMTSCVGQWDSLPAAAQLAVLDAHLQFGSEALETVHLASQSPYLPVRVAAWQAMAVLKDASLIPAAISAASKAQEEEQKAARNALVQMHGTEMYDALVGHLDRADVQEKMVILGVLGKRGQLQAVSLLLDYAASPESSVRAAALDALAQMAVADTLVPLLDLMVAAKTNADRQKIQKSLMAVCQSSPDKTQAGQWVIAALHRMPASECHYLLPLLVKTPSPEALNELQTAARSDQKQVAQEAIRTLGLWPDAAPTTQLFEMARTHTDPYLRILALRGGIATAGMEPDLSVRVAMLNDAIAMANRAEEKKLALSYLARTPHIKSLASAMSCLEVGPIADEAALAAVQIADQLIYTNQKEAVDALNRILQRPAASSIKETAAAVLSKCETIKGFLAGWQISGPYTLESNNFNLFLDTQFAPESQHGYVLPWVTITGGSADDHPYKVDIKRAYPLVVCTAYCRTKVWSDKDRRVRVEVGSDDGFKFWINGKLFGKNPAARGYLPAQDIFEADLRKGWNLVMIKITQFTAGWEFSVKLTEIDGSPISDLFVTLDIGKDDIPSAVEPNMSGLVKDVEGTLRFERMRIGDVTYEAASAFDVNNDGTTDIVSGEYWFAGPDYTQKHKICTVQPVGDYYDDFSDFPMDVNGDGYLDIITGGWWGETLRWRENPRGQPTEWTVHDIEKTGNIETTRFWDVDGDGFVEIVPNAGGNLIVYQLVRDEHQKGTGKFNKHIIQQGGIGHGLGFGDINGDERGDFVVSNGWFESPQKPFTDKWTFHQEFDLGAASVPILVYDADGDGLADLIEGQAHGYGLNWRQQKKDQDGKRVWTTHEIDPNRSQYHDLVLADLDNDGTPELITGKRYRAHGDHDPGSFDPVGLYYFKIENGMFKRITLDYGPAGQSSGAGIFLWVEDMDGNGFKDILAPGKEGLYLFKNSGPAS